MDTRREHHTRGSLIILQRSRIVGCRGERYLRREGGGILHRATRQLHQMHPIVRRIIPARTVCAAYATEKSRIPRLRIVSVDRRSIYRLRDRGRSRRCFCIRSRRHQMLLYLNNITARQIGIVYAADCRKDRSPTRRAGISSIIVQHGGISGCVKIRMRRKRGVYPVRFVVIAVIVLIEGEFNQLQRIRSGR